MVLRKIVEQKAKVGSLFSQLPSSSTTTVSLADDGFQRFIHGTCTMAQLFLTITLPLPQMGFYGNSAAESLMVRLPAATSSLHPTV